jgi:single-strand DNA-binding protein
MAASMNLVVLMGNLTRDPELRSLPSGSSVCAMGLAVNERFKAQSGDYEERVNFFDITCFGSQAENCAKYLSKGRPIAVQGRLRWSSWEKDGQKRSKVEVIADRVQFLSDGKDKRPEQESDIGGYEPETPATQSFSHGGDEDIPF